LADSVAKVESCRAANFSRRDRSGADRDVRDLTETLIVMLSVPFALVGGLWLMWWLGFNLSSPSPSALRWPASPPKRAS
jgi:hypothetical protein